MASRQERENLKKAYPSKEWACKVDKMSDSQVATIYLRLKNQGKVV